MERVIGGSDRPMAGLRAPACPDLQPLRSGAAARSVTVRLDRRSLRGWHIRLLDQLGQRPDRRVRIAWVTQGGGLPANAELLFRLEAAIHGLPRPGLATAAEPVALAPYEARPDETVTTGDDIVLDLSGAPAAPTDSSTTAPVWRLDFDGLPGEAGLLAALFARRAPVAALRGPDGAPVAVGRLGAESHTVMLAAFEDYLARTITLIAAALDGAGSLNLPDGAEAPLQPGRAFDLDGFGAGRRAAGGLARQIARRLYALCFQGPQWRVGWRQVVGPDLIDLRRHPEGGWNDLPDDGRRFYADPFAIARNGAVTLFVEEFDYRRGKGVISAVDFEVDGPRGRPEPVLELETHLSYPFVFEADGQVWMIPESHASGTIDLYRATAFPRGWVHEAVLVDGVVASDATLLHHGGRWWLFATVRAGGGSYSDTLHLWHAPHFRGPWTPHRRNPVLIDVGSARAAGPVVARGGALIRPVQDCRGGYGAALGLARILRLDEEGYAQRVETRLGPGAAWPGSRLHMLSAAGGLEFIDGSRPARPRLLR
ncbi:formyl transferase [Methylobacterium sp. J-088]|uniref:glucosamine inositolphosphorylceramide transferase family protein n=1 Tax=Methylobacterium sp. J-088 TaxID=2836664 RepID=UPI001FB9ACDE|nr:formyl transferase [Methylobacterium sp. J-088]MCJ2065601.1 formyl transferase [Methylobacterium sp. J-088]